MGLDLGTLLAKRLVGMAGNADDLAEPDGIGGLMCIAAFLTGSLVVPIGIMTCG